MFDQFTNYVARALQKAARVLDVCTADQDALFMEHELSFLTGVISLLRYPAHIDFVRVSLDRLERTNQLRLQVTALLPELSGEEEESSALFAV